MSWIKAILENHLAKMPNHKLLYDEQTCLNFQQVYNLSGRVYAYLKSNGVGKEDFRVDFPAQRSIKDCYISK